MDKIEFFPTSKLNSDQIINRVNAFVMVLTVEARVHLLLDVDMVIFLL